MLILYLSGHGCGVLFVHRCHFSGPGSHLDATCSAVETHAGFASAAPANLVLVNVAFDVDVDVIDRAVVVKMAAAPVAAFVPEAYVAEAVVDAAIVAHVPAPVAAIKAVVVMPEAPVAGGPESALVGSLNPRARYPVIAHWSKGPVAGRPDVVVAGILRLIVIGQGGRRLRSVSVRLLSVTGIIRRLALHLVLHLVLGISLVGRWRGLLFAGSAIRCVLR